MPELDMWQPARMASGHSAKHIRGLAKSQGTREQLGNTDRKYASNNGRDSARRDRGPSKGWREVCLHGNPDCSA